jgi:hypothetical protein
MSSETNIFKLSYFPGLCCRYFCLNVCGKLMIFSAAFIRQLLSKKGFSWEVKAVLLFFLRKGVHSSILKNHFYFLLFLCLLAVSQFVRKKKEQFGRDLRHYLV